MTAPATDLLVKAHALLNAIERRWAGETQRKRDNAISPMQQAAMDCLRQELGRWREPTEAELAEVRAELLSIIDKEGAQ